MLTRDAYVDTNKDAYRGSIIKLLIELRMRTRTFYAHLGHFGDQNFPW